MVAILTMSGRLPLISTRHKASKLQAYKGQKARDFYVGDYQKVEML